MIVKGVRGEKTQVEGKPYNTQSILLCVKIHQNSKTDNSHRIFKFKISKMVMVVLRDRERQLSTVTIRPIQWC